MMKKKMALLLGLGVVASLGLTGCSNYVAKNLGGNMTLKLEKGEKLETITWKDSELWYLTRPMRDGEEPEEWKFREVNDLGILEGTVTIIESK